MKNYNCMYWDKHKLKCIEIKANNYKEAKHKAYKLLGCYNFSIYLIKQNETKMKTLLFFLLCGVRQ